MQFIDSLIPLFDIDWTLLVGKNQAHLDAFRYMFTKVFNQPTASLSDIHPAGMIDSQIIVEILKMHGIAEEISKNKLHEAFFVMNQYYKENAQEKHIIKLPGVDQLLEKLSRANVLIGVLSGNIEDMAWNKLSVANIKHYFSFGVFGDMAMRRYELVDVASKQIKEKYGIISNNRFVNIGDSPLDIACAKETGIRSIGVATGSSSPEKLIEAGADLVVSNLEEIDRIFTFITRPTDVSVS